MINRICLSGSDSDRLFSTLNEVRDFILGDSCTRRVHCTER